MKKGQRKRVWTKEQKLEIVHKHLDEHISIKKLGKEYGINHGMVQIVTVTGQLGRNSRPVWATMPGRLGA